MSQSKPINIDEIRQDFPILQQEVNGSPLVYLDNAATTQKPSVVIDALNDYYQTTNSNVHRGAHALSDQATQEFEQARSTVQAFINAKAREEIIWTRGTTESINLVAQTWGQANLKSGDEIIVSQLEHHSNIVPWQMLCQQNNCQLKVVDIQANGELDFESFEKLVNEKTKLVAIGHTSNALGVINPIKAIIKLAHQYGAKVLVDGAQSTPHFEIDVQALDCDFYAFSGHKVFAPTGIGVLYGKQALLDSMPPWHGGGEMIEKVSFSGTTYNQLPYKFEAGTPNIAGVIGLSKAIDYLNQFDRQLLLDHENQLIQYATDKAKAFESIQIIGDTKNKASVLSFVMPGYHAQDVGMILDQQGIAVRTGHHCAMPLMQHLGIDGTIRASFAFYNTESEVDRLFVGLEKALSFL